VLESVAVKALYLGVKRLVEIKLDREYGLPEECGLTNIAEDWFAVEEEGNLH
jgi:hypothetical protein